LSSVGGAFPEFSPDGRLYSGGIRGDVLFDFESGKTVGSMPQQGFHARRFTPDGKLLVTTGETRLACWSLEDPANPRLLSQFESTTLDVCFLSIASDGKAVVVRDRSKGCAAVFSLPDLTMIHPFDPAPLIYAIAIQPKGRHLAALLENRKVQIWEAARTSLTPPLEQLVDHDRSAGLRSDFRVGISGQEEGVGWSESRARRITAVSLARSQRIQTAPCVVITPPMISRSG